MTETIDIAVIGAGPIGHAAALLLAESGRSVALVGPDVSADETRTTALLQGSIRLFEHLGAWTAMERHGAPLQAMRLVDDTGRLFRAPEVLFHAEEIGEEAFGTNVPVKFVTAALAERVADSAAIRRIAATVDDVDYRSEAAVLSLSDGSTLAAQLIVAGDGRLSVCREAAGIRVSEHRYPQVAVVGNFDHDRPHTNISTEFHRTTGPFTLVPLPGNTSSLVCVVTPEEAADLMAAEDAAFEAMLEERSHRLLGKVRVSGPRRSYPLVHQTAARFTGPRLALIGEAAHVMPPIGAQGLNLGLRDVASLFDALAQSLQSARLEGLDQSLAAYERSRGLDVRTRMTVVDVLNRSLLSGFLALQGARSLGMHAVKTFGPLRRLVMREGLQPSYATPSVMRG